MFITTFTGVFRTRNIHVFICTLSQCFRYKSTAGCVVTNEMRVSDRQQLPFGSCPFDESNESVEATTLNREFTPGLLSVMRCDFPIYNIQVSGRVHSTNRMNRSNRQR